MHFLRLENSHTFIKLLKKLNKKSAGSKSVRINLHLLRCGCVKNLLPHNLTLITTKVSHMIKHNSRVKERVLESGFFFGFLFFWQPRENEESLSMQLPARGHEGVWLPNPL
jgi:hypothetical protein